MEKRFVTKNAVQSFIKIKINMNIWDSEAILFSELNIKYLKGYQNELLSGQLRQWSGEIVAMRWVVWNKMNNLHREKSWRWQSSSTV